MLTTRQALVVAALVPVLAGLTACSDGDGDNGDNKDASTSASCTALPTADPSAKLPEAYPALDGQVLYEPSTQGKTDIVFGLVHKSDFVAVRDELVEKLKTNGWTIDGTDQESVEAEAQFSKTPPLKAGTVKVQPFCEGYVSVRYKLNN